MTNPLSGGIRVDKFILIFSDREMRRSGAASFSYRGGNANLKLEIHFKVVPASEVGTAWFAFPA
jgi:hypothetical protein